MLQKLFHWFAAGVAMVMCVTSAQAQTKKADGWTDFPNVSIRLAAGSSLPDGNRALVIELKLAAGWKTYWRMPGDAGIPPTFDWQGSGNLASADVLYPAPVAMSDQGGTAIGYKGEVSFPVILTPHDARSPIKLFLEFNLGVCKEVCIPVEARLAAELQPGDTDKNELWLRAVSRVPTRRDLTASKTTNPALLSAKGEFGGSASRLSFETRGATDVFVEAPDGLYVPLAQRTAQDTFVVDLSKTADAKDLVGKSLRLTIVGPALAIETNWTWTMP